MIAASINLTGNIISFSQAVTSNTSEIIESEQQAEVPTDLISQIFNSQITTMMLSTLIIAVVGIVINKFRKFKKTFDMVEILVKSQVKMKNHINERDQKIEERLNKFEEKYKIKIEDIWEGIDETNQKVDRVKDEATKALIDFLSRKKD